MSERSATQVIDHSLSTDDDETAEKLRRLRNLGLIDQ